MLVLGCRNIVLKLGIDEQDSDASISSISSLGKSERPKNILRWEAETV
jgi:hypothetical protein